MKMGEQFRNDMDYDGMGDQGRFPVKGQVKKNEFDVLKHFQLLLQYSFQ